MYLRTWPFFIWSVYRSVWVRVKNYTVIHKVWTELGITVLEWSIIKDTELKAGFWNIFSFFEVKTMLTPFTANVAYNLKKFQ